MTMRIAVVFALITLFFALRMQRGSWGDPALDCYTCYADNLLTGHGYWGDGYTLPGIPNAYRLPAYPIFLAISATTFGRNAVIPFQAVLASFIVFLVTGFVGRMTDKIMPTVVTGAIALSGHQLYYFASLTLTELFAAFTMTIFVIFFAQRRYIMAGATFGILLLTRGSFVFTLPLILGVILLCGKQ